ncbi:putative c2hc5 finger protein [Erysiphe necator]|uniref:Putative c2hc5 finger protein n=1 Tax=Uncinula necator TaxID=52586 RepID=A0A0B1P2X9_UNCNE|nr:putative c2hc5 finger protein [Erysiphe necator]
MSLTQLSQLLPLPIEDLQQILDYTRTLSSDEAADHLNNLLGQSSQTTKFISDFNSSQKGDIKNLSSPTSKNFYSSSTKKSNEKRLQLKKREVKENLTYGNPYYKNDEENYIGTSKKTVVDKTNSKNVASSRKSQSPYTVSSSGAAGTLISDSSYRQTKKISSVSKGSGSGSSSRSSNKTKISISGGKALHGESTVISELDAAIRALEISTNVKLNSQNLSRRTCNCIGTRHPILTAAPNCLSCGKVICIMEGLGPCTFCGVPLLSSAEVQTMISHLKEERGREKMISDNRSKKRAEIASTPKAFSTLKGNSSDFHIGEDQTSSAKIEAQAHRDKLLNFQAQNAKRTTVQDEVADFNIDEHEVRRDMLWASPLERAKALKKQQKLRQEIEWQAKPEYEKRKVIVSLDVFNGKVIKQIRNTVQEREDENTRVDRKSENVNTLTSPDETHDQKISQNFTNNLLIGNLVRPIWSAKVNQKAEIKKEESEKGFKWGVNNWRRVLDDQDDNEEIILDGGFSGG